MVEQQMVTLVSVDNVSFELPVEAAMIAGMIREMLDPDEGLPETIKPIELVKIREEPLRYVVEFLQQYSANPMQPIEVPLTGNSVEEVIQPAWYNDFITNMPDAMLFEVLTAANFLHIQPLLDLACLKVTFNIQGKDADEIRQELNLPELSAEEEEQARRDHRWMFEDN